jgi:arylsulfatase A-like enzyme
MSNGSTRREFLTGLGGLAAAQALAPFTFAKDGPPPNILWIMADDHARHALSCYGSKINRTPNLDRIATEGIRFDNAFCTNSLCAPSRAVLLTGKYSHINGMLDNKDSSVFDGSQQTFPKLLRKAGYRTGVIGKWHLVSDPTGFDYWNILPGQGVYHDPIFIEMGTKKKRPGYVTDIITDDSMKFIKESAGKPFCLLMHHKAPHRRWEPDDKHMSMYADKDVAEPETFNDDYRNRAGAAEHADMRIANMPDWVKEQPAGMTPEQTKHWNYERFIKDYLRVIASIDDNVGRVLEMLDRAGLAKNTVVAYTSDNGFFLGDHGWFDKRFMYQESHSLPLLFRYPALIAAGRAEKHMVLNLDFAPTLLALAGVPVPSDIQGMSMLPLLKGEKNARWRESVYYHYYEYPDWHRVRPHYGVRTERYKLIHYPTVDEWELFDLKNDPHELKSIYNDGNQAGLIQKLKAELARLRAQYKDNT